MSDLESIQAAIEKIEAVIRSNREIKFLGTTHEMWLKKVLTSLRVHAARKMEA